MKVFFIYLILFINLYIFSNENDFLIFIKNNDGIYKFDPNKNNIEKIYDIVGKNFEIFETQLFVPVFFQNENEVIITVKPEFIKNETAEYKFSSNLYKFYLINIKSKSLIIYKTILIESYNYKNTLKNNHSVRTDIYNERGEIINTIKMNYNKLEDIYRNYIKGENINFILRETDDNYIHFKTSNIVNNIQAFSNKGNLYIVSNGIIELLSKNKINKNEDEFKYNIKYCYGYDAPDLLSNGKKILVFIKLRQYSFLFPKKNELIEYDIYRKKNILFGYYYGREARYSFTGEYISYYNYNKQKIIILDYKRKKIINEIKCDMYCWYMDNK